LLRGLCDKQYDANSKKGYINFFRRVKAFEDKLNGYNKEVEAFRKKEVRTN